MTYIRYALLGIIGAVFLTVALANRSMTTVKLLPDTLATFFGGNLSVTMPLFMIVGGAVVAGLLLGFIWEWLRERGYRSEAARARRAAEELRTELGRVQKSAPETQKDDVLAIVEASEARSRKTTIPAVR